MVRMLESVRKGRGMLFLRRGMAVDGKRGVVTGGNTAMTIQVRFQGQRHSCNCHPTWETTYYGRDGTIMAEYKQQAQSPSPSGEQGSGAPVGERSSSVSGEQSA